MNALRQNDRVVLTFNFLESTILRRVFVEIIRNYKLKPDELDPKLASVWYSTRGCKSARMTAEETEDWLATLHQCKSANLQRLEAWQKTIAKRHASQYQLDLSLDDAHALMTALNDHRLLTAARYDIGQQEMDLRSGEGLDKLKPARQAALFSIHLLACIIEELLQLISPEAASWLEEIEW